MDFKILKIPNHSHFNDFCLKITEEKNPNMKADGLFHKFFMSSLRNQNKGVERKPGMASVMSSFLVGTKSSWIRRQVRPRGCLGLSGREWGCLLRNPRGNNPSVALLGKGVEGRISFCLSHEFFSSYQA